MKEFSDSALEQLRSVEDRLCERWRIIDRLVLRNQAKVLFAFQQERIGLHHFQTSTGYGYNDLSREALEKLFARVFKTEAALVRQHFASGTHAITCCLRGILRPGDEIVFANDKPYDTLQAVFGINESPPTGSLKEYGITTRIAPLNEHGNIDLEAVKSLINPKTKVLAFQRSSGYSGHRPLSVGEMEKAINELRRILPQDAVIFVDNCYGEFVEEKEPTEIGADIIAGSLIKNPGGGLAPSGGYIAGRSSLVEQAAASLFAPGIGGEVGATLINPRPFFQGFFEAPYRVGEMLKSATLWAAVFENKGLKAIPTPDEERTDVIQQVQFETGDNLQNFCRILQETSPVDSHLRPVPDQMPGYDHPVIMAAGTFISGSTSELSVDAPFVPPFIAYLQGGLTLSQTRLAVLHWLDVWKN